MVHGIGSGSGMAVGVDVAVGSGVLVEIGVCVGTIVLVEIEVCVGTIVLVWVLLHPERIEAISKQNISTTTGFRLMSAFPRSFKWDFVTACILDFEI
jgi:hypothetical protein